MNIQQFENFIQTTINDVIVEIVKKTPFLPISAKARAGAEISDWLEKEFVKETKSSKVLLNSEASPEGKTKNPWDARTTFKYKDIEEEIWIDFKALKVSASDSNPDIGTPTKMIDFIKKGNFYLLFIFVYYQEKNEGLEFVKLNHKLTKCYFLKDISSTFRRNPKNQLQVNISAEPEYRTREEFINLFMKKIKESHIRQIEISKNKLKEIDSITELLIDTNKKSEYNIIKMI